MKKYLNKIEKSSKKLSDFYKETFSQTIDSLNKMIEAFKSSTQFKDAELTGAIDGDDEGGLSYSLLFGVGDKNSYYLTEEGDSSELIEKFNPTKDELEKVETILKVIGVLSKSSMFKEIVEHYE